ncbi:MAG TPA: DUF2249 domain-containing protein [Myxococcales bacterium]|nr:DUF2249 domain-containing protein [Myxococcales bacterium]
MAETMPASVKAARETVLDARPILAKGGDPFRLIMRTVGELKQDEALHLLVGFDPLPLYTVLKSQGFAAHTQIADGVFHVWFWREGPGKQRHEVPPFKERTGLQDPVGLDVRGLEPPQPMITILEKLAQLGDGAQLLVRHHREPVLLYEKLQARGYAAKTSRRAEGDYLVHIAPDWVFAPEAA